MRIKPATQVPFLPTVRKCRKDPDGPFQINSVEAAALGALFVFNRDCEIHRTGIGAINRVVPRARAGDDIAV